MDIYPNYPFPYRQKIVEKKFRQAFGWNSALLKEPGKGGPAQRLGGFLRPEGEKYVTVQQAAEKK